MADVSLIFGHENRPACGLLDGRQAGRQAGEQANWPQEGGGWTVFGRFWQMGETQCACLDSLSPTVTLAYALGLARFVMLASCCVKNICLTRCSERSDAGFYRLRCIWFSRQT